jgi:hypothetical protein
MSVDAEFANAVSAVIGANELVPCYRPLTGINLLQLLGRDHVQGIGLFNRGGHILANSGHPPYTLIYFVQEVSEQEQQARTLQDIVHDVAVEEIMTFSMERSALTRSGLSISFNQLDEDLARVGLKATSDVSWNLTFGDGPITKASVSPDRLRRFLEEHAVHRHPGMNDIKGVVTAIYYVAEGLTYTGRSERVAFSGLQLDPAPARFDITAGWSRKVTESRDVIVSQTNSHPWIIAIEFMDFDRIGRRWWSCV